jgi:hypothetical protein
MASGLERNILLYVKFNRCALEVKLRKTRKNECVQRAWRVRNGQISGQHVATMHAEVLEARVESAASMNPIRKAPSVHNCTKWIWT